MKDRLQTGTMRSELLPRNALSTWPLQSGTVATGFHSSQALSVITKIFIGCLLCLEVHTFTAGDTSILQDFPFSLHKLHLLLKVIKCILLL